MDPRVRVKFVDLEETLDRLNELFRKHKYNEVVRETRVTEVNLTFFNAVLDELEEIKQTTRSLGEYID